MKTRTKVQLATKLAATEPRVRAIYVSTYIPRECGIATFTKDLTTAINVLNPYYLADIVAIDDSRVRGEDYNYPWEVKYRIHQEDLKSWLDAAEYINQSGAQVVSLQHEFGIYGGNSGEYAIAFAEAIKKPLVITFHTVISKPNEQIRHIVKRLANRANGIVVMVKTAIRRLECIYKIDSKKMVVIPHGVPDIPFTNPELMKKKLRLSGYKIISGFGLLSKGKGYETIIEAMPKIVSKHPNTKLLILGETHPVVKRKEGESYRQFLVNLVKEKKLKNAVSFVNRYLTLEEVVNYLQASDIYVTPYSGLDQITSGTLAYAIGAGKPCVSSPYLYAREALDEGRGILAQENNPEEWAKSLNYLLDNPKKAHDIAKKAYAFGRNMIWPSVALRYLDLFEIVSEAHGKN